MVSDVLACPGESGEEAGYRKDRYRVFRKLGQFRTLDPAAYAALQGHLADRVQTLGRHVPLIESGDPSTDMLIVLDGWAASCRPIKDSRPQIVALHLPGDICDISIAKTQMDCSIVALADLKIASISRVTLIRLATQHPTIGLALWWEAACATATRGQWIARLAQSSARACIANLLCELAVRLFAVGLADDSGFDIPIAQVDLANGCGLTPEHTNRVMSELRRSGVASWDKGRLRLLDWDALRTIADFDPTYLHFRHLRRD